MTQPLIHGGDWAGFEAQYGRPPLDFSANVSPLGLPESVRRAVEASLPHADRYPDPLCRALTGALAQAEGLPAAWLLCGAGAADLIYRLVLALRPARALVCAPTFAEYGEALTLAGCELLRCPLTAEQGFAVPEAILEAIAPGVELVFLCEPNNPTGRTTPRPLLDRILARCQSVGARLVVDECFNEFLDDPAAHTMKGRLSGCENLLILNAFTKIYAMAGLRLGWCACSDEALLARMAKAGPPWAVSGPAQAAGLAALALTDYPAQVRALVQAQRPRLAQGLARLGLAVYPGEANYLLLHSPHPGLADAMRGQGVLIRDCANYPGLGPGYYRVAVRTEAENDRLLAALAAVLSAASR